MSVSLRTSLLSVAVLVICAGLAEAAYYPAGDLDEGRDVDMDDLRLFAQNWLNPACNVPGCEADLNGEDGVNMADYALLTRDWGGIAIITEFMASNHSDEPLGPGEILDEEGKSSDWIEIHNPTDTVVNLDGWYLTHDPCELTEWRFPAVKLEPGQFMIVFASGENRRDPDPNKPLHTNFKLNQEGDYLAIARRDGKTVVHEYAQEYPAQFADISYGLAQYAQLLVPSQAEASYHVPTASDAETNWTTVWFDDSSWDTAKTGLGFAQVQGEVIDVTTPGDVVQGVPNDGDWPGNEAPPLAIDNNVNAKYLHFKGDFDPGDPPGGAGFQVTPSIGPSIVTGLTFTTANDAAERDPTAFALYGSNTTIDGPYTLIATASIFDFAQVSAWPRFTKNTTPITFANNTAYYHYQLLFPAIRDERSSVAMQIGEVELLGSSAGAAVSNIEEQMLNTNASLWVRIEFEAEEVEFFSSMTLRVRYEDGFVAYLNGDEIGRRNFTGVPSWNSTAESNRPVEESEEFVSIDVSDHLGALREGGNILAIQGLNDAKGDGEFLILPELVAAGEVSVAHYLTTATPGQYNTSGLLDVVADTKFSRNRGFYDAAFSVTITTETQGATIHYTTNGSTPSETHGIEYVGPINVNKTTCLRAMAFKTLCMSTNVDTHTYIFLDNVINQPANPAGFPSTWNGTAADYEMDPDILNDSRYEGLMRDSLLSLPSVSIVSDIDNLFGPSGIYSNPVSEGVAWERPASVEWINPDGSTAFQVDCGLRIYGGAFRRMDLTRKKTFRFLFKRGYGPTKLRYPLFGEEAADEFDTIILRGGANDGWNNWGGTNTQYIVDEFMRRTQLALGQPSGHGTFVHVYVNGLYWGLYNPVERPERSFAATYFGGDKEEWDAINAGSLVGGSSATTWNAMLSIIRGGMAGNEAYQRIQGNNPDGTNNPGYDDLLDMDNYIDYLFSNFWGGTGDWGGRNWYVACRRPPNAIGFKFFNWDSEGAIVIWSGLTTNVTGRGEAIQEPYKYLRQNVEFRMLFADHVHRHMFNDGPGTPQASYERYKELSDFVESAIIAESARWGDQASGTLYTPAHWQSRRDYALNTYMPQRPAIVLGQLRGAGLYPQLDAPVIHVNSHYQHGGEILPTDAISMILTADVFYIDTELVAEGALARAHVPVDDRLGLAWTERTFVPESGWTDGTTGTGVGYEASSGYQGWIKTDIRDQMYGKGTSVFVRIEFDWDGSEEFDKLQLQMRSDDGFIAYLNGARACNSNNVTNEVPGTATAGNHEASETYDEYDMTSVLDELVIGTNVLAIHGINVSTGSSDMIVLPRLIGRIIDETLLTRPVLYTADGSDPRQPGGGRNPESIEYTVSFSLSESARVKTRTFYNNQWSALNEATFAVGPVAANLRIAEIMFHPQDTGDPNDPNEEYIELQNVSSKPINLNMVRFTNGIYFTFASVSLAGGDYLLVVRDQAAFEAAHPDFSGVIVGEYSGSLNNGGERIELEDAIGQTILNFRYGDDWRPITDGEGFSLTIVEPHHPDPNSWALKDSWRASAYVGGSPGSDDSGILPNPGDIAINEVLAHSHAEAADWIELYNTTGAEIEIGGWYLSDSRSDLKKYRIADGEKIGAYDYLVLREDVNFGEFSPPPADPGRVTGFALSENGDEVYLSSAESGILMGYREAEDFGASPTGVSFGRYFKTSTGNYNFVLMDHETPGWANAYPKVGPIVISEIMYNPASGDQRQEYIELHNFGSTAVTLYDSNEGEPWKFTDGVDYTFPDYPGLTISAGGYVLIVKDIPAYINEYGVPPSGVMLLGSYGGNLSNSGEKLKLSRPGDVDEFGIRYYIRVEQVNYGDGSHHEDAPGGIDLWPTEADGGGMSLRRIDTTLYGNDPNNWTAAELSPGGPG